MPFILGLRSPPAAGMDRRRAGKAKRPQQWDTTLSIQAPLSGPCGESCFRVDWCGGAPIRARRPPAPL